MRKIVGVFLFLFGVALVEPGQGASLLEAQFLTGKRTPLSHRTEASFCASALYELRQEIQSSRYLMRVGPSDRSYYVQRLSRSFTELYHSQLGFPVDVPWPWGFASSIDGRKSSSENFGSQQLAYHLELLAGLDLSEDFAYMLQGAAAESFVQQALLNQRRTDSVAPGVGVERRALPLVAAYTSNSHSSWAFVSHSVDVPWPWVLNVEDILSSDTATALVEKGRPKVGFARMWSSITRGFFGLFPEASEDNARLTLNLFVHKTEWGQTRLLIYGRARQKSYDRWGNERPHLTGYKAK